MPLTLKQTNKLTRRQRPAPMPRFIRNVNLRVPVWNAVDEEARRQNRSANNLIESILWEMLGTGEPLQ